MVKALHLSSVIVAECQDWAPSTAVVLTADYMKARNLPMKGVIFNRFHPGSLIEEDNIIMCESMTGLPTLAKVQDGAMELEIDIDVLTSLYH